MSIAMAKVEEELLKLNIKFNVLSKTKIQISFDYNELTPYVIVVEEMDEGNNFDITCGFINLERKPVTEILKFVNDDLNMNYRYFCFVVKEKQLLFHCTAITKENNSADEILELIFRAVKVYEHIYPQVQRLLTADEVVSGSC